MLGQGASAEAKFQPDASKLTVKTLVGEARVITSAKNLILVENTEGRTEILLPNGRLIIVEPGKAEIVGRALVDDPGNITIRLSGTGPIAQAGGATPAFATSSVDVTVLDSRPALDHRPAGHAEKLQSRLYERLRDSVSSFGCDTREPKS